MGGKRKILTQTRRTALKKEMTEALLAGTFTTNGRPIDEVLDEVNQGIVDERYPIEVDLSTLIGIWTGNPAPSEAPAPQPPTNHGTVDQIQQAVAQLNGQPIPVNVHSGGQVNGQPAEQWQAQQAAQGYGPTPQQAAEIGLPPGSPVVSPETAAAIGYPRFPSESPPFAAGIAPGQTPNLPQVTAQAGVWQASDGIPPMTLQQAQDAMSTAESLEIGQPPKEQPVEVDATPVADWLNLAKQADAKIKALKDIYEQAKANAAAYADQIGGPDRSKVLLLNGQLVMRRTFVRKKVFQKDALLAAHPEIDETTFTDTTSFYKTELV